MNPRFARFFSHAVQHTRGWGYLDDLAELERLETASTDEIEAHRLERLRRLVQYCQTVPFYREVIDSHRIDPAGFTFEDLESFPIVDKRTLRQDYLRFHSATGDRSFETWASSGSTGEPFQFHLDRQSVKRNTFAALARGRRWWGLDFGIPELMVWSGVRDVSMSSTGQFAALRRKLSWRMKNIFLIDTYDLTAAKVKVAFEHLRRFSPISSRSISSGLYRFCRLIDELGLDGTELGIRHAIYTGEALPPAQRAYVERILECKTICEYGCTELGIIAFECPSGGLHLSHENLHFEFLTDGRPAAPGETASLVVTNLNDLAAPLVRYSVGDFVVAADSACACGRAMPTIREVSGRSHAAIHTPGGAVVNGLFFTHLFDTIPEVHRFRVIQERLDRLEMELTSNEQIAESSITKIRSSVSKVLGDAVDIRVRQVPDLPLDPNGKFRWIESKIAPTPATSKVD